MSFLLPLHGAIITETDKDMISNYGRFSTTHRMSGARLVLICAILVSVTGCTVVPRPVDTFKHRDKLTIDLKAAYARQESIERPVTLEEATARTIRYNLDYRLNIMQEALALGEFKAARWDMLPRLAASAGYSHRSNPSASSSLNLSTGDYNYSASTSQDENLRTADLGVVWNVLDFGVSYYQARQQADRHLIWKERRRKVVHNLIQEVRFAYWQAVGATRLQSKVRRVLDKANQSLERIQREKEAHLRPRLTVLKEEKALLETVRQMQSILDELAVAKPRLAALMGLPPGTAYEVAVVDLHRNTIPGITIPLEELEQLALKYRPELREATYQQRISAHEVRKAMVRLLPGIEFRGSREYNSNSFAAYPNWWEAGINVSWNLMNIPAAPARIDAAKAGKAVAEASKLALSMAVLSQVYVSQHQFETSLRQYGLIRNQWEVEEQILALVRAGREVKAQSEREFIHAEVNTVKSELAMYQSYATLEQARGNVYASLGLDPLPDMSADLPLEELTAVLGNAMNAWRLGQLTWADDEAEKARTIARLYQQGEEQFAEEAYDDARETFASILELDARNQAARQYNDVLIPARMEGIEKADELRHRAGQAARLVQEGQLEEARELWHSIITEAQKELKP